jgi:hypothetical protein
MKKPETCAAQAEIKSSADATLEAPIRLTPEQLETVAAGMIATSGGTSKGATLGMIKPF